MKVHDDVLEAAFLDGRDAPRVREHLATCAACRERLEELDRLSHDMEAIAAEEREDLAAARAAERAGEELDPRFEALLDEHRVRSRAPSPVPVRRPIWVLLTAAASLTLVLFAGRQLLLKPDDNPLMGDEGRIELQASSSSTLEWSYDLPEGGYYMLEVFEATEQGPGEVVVERMRVEEGQWSTSDMVFEQSLPSTFFVRIEAFTEGSRPLATLFERVSR